MTEYEKYCLFFSGIEGIGAVAADRLEAVFGSLKEAALASRKELMEDGGLTAAMAGQVAAGRETFDAEAEEKRMKELGISFVCRRSAGYPERLKDIASPPNVLFYRGGLPEASRPAVAVIGSRGCSAYGREVSLSFSKELARVGIDIISGMAAGIDGYSHRGALSGGGRTYAVLGCGADICYPEGNRDIYDAIPEHGGILSEFSPGTAPIPRNFPRRNRIIAGLADGILVVEARARSGTSITVGMGLEQGKDIYAIPGRIGDRLSDGCNSLIRQGARLVTSPADIVAEMAGTYGYMADRSVPEKEREKHRHPGLTSDEEAVFAALNAEPKSTAQLAMATGLDCSEILAAVTMLELHGMCRSVGNGSFTASVEEKR